MAVSSQRCRDAYFSSVRDLKRPWAAITKRAELIGVRVHDLRRTYASFGADGGLGLPIIGRLLDTQRVMLTSITICFDARVSNSGMVSTGK
jgi:integrase